jgi:hypothetical protein
LMIDKFDSKYIPNINKKNNYFFTKEIFFYRF